MKLVPSGVALLVLYKEMEALQVHWTVKTPKGRLPVGATRLDTEYVQSTFHHVLLEVTYFVSRK